MMKVFLEGFNEPYAVLGKYVSEDERYLVLMDGGIKRKIPQKRIVHIEDLSEVVEPIPEQKPQIEKLEQVKKALVNRGVATPKEDLGNLTKANIIITGEVSKNLMINVPELLLASGKYNPGLMKEISNMNEIKSIMEGGIIFDGVPVVQGNNVYIKTKTLGGGGTSAAIGSIGLATKVAGAMGGFKKPNKAYPTQFGMKGHQPEDFAIEQSPFDGPVRLNDNDDDEEVVNESAGTEDPSDQEPDGEPVPPVQE